MIEQAKLSPNKLPIPVFSGVALMFDPILHRRGLAVAGFNRPEGNYEIQAFQKKGKPQWLRNIPPELKRELNDVLFRVYSPEDKLVAYAYGTLQDSDQERVFYGFDIHNLTRFSRTNQKTRLVEEMIVSLLQQRVIDTYISSIPSFLTDDSKAMFAHLKEIEAEREIIVNQNEKGQIIIRRREAA